MQTFDERVAQLDTGLFQPIQSQTTGDDKRSLLKLQDCVRKQGSYVYLEIGSHLGGSLQPHVIDPRCAVIHSVDLRPQIAPDDRSKEFVKVFKDNSTARMLENLKAVSAEGIAKIRTYDMDSKDVPREAIARPLHLAFIDGEHTRAAVIRDYELCRTNLAEGGVILFHDLYIVFPAIVEIIDGLKKQGVQVLPAKLERSVFGLFFDPALVHGDETLSASYRDNLPTFNRLLRRYRLKNMLPRLLREALRS